MDYGFLWGVIALACGTVMLVYGAAMFRVVLAFAGFYIGFALVSGWLGALTSGPSPARFTSTPSQESSSSPGRAAASSASALPTATTLSPSPANKAESQSRWVGLLSTSSSRALSGMAAANSMLPEA